MIRVAAIPALAMLASAPAFAGDAFTDSLAESRLRGCLLAGASSAGQSDLAGKVIEVRAFCGAQIARVRDQRVAAATAQAVNLQDAISVLRLVVGLDINPAGQALSPSPYIDALRSATVAPGAAR